MIQFGPEILHDLDRALQLEWLETNGLGGFASCSVAGASTRRYHGVLVAATRPPGGRRVLLPRLEEQLSCDGATYDLATSVYQGDVIHPHGYLNLVDFRLDPWPVMTYQCGDSTVVKSVMMRHGLNQTLVAYQLAAASAPCRLSVRPLVAGRDYHHLQTARGDLNAEWHGDAQSLVITPYDEQSQLALSFPHGQFWPDGLWYYGYLYQRERERGLDYAEDLYSPGVITWLVTPGTTVYLCAATDLPDSWEPEQWLAAERDRRSALVAYLPATDEIGRTLSLAADQFVVRRWSRDRENWSIIAGYPWFTDWGRDTMVALPGLLLATGRPDEAKSVLQTFAETAQEGLLPNVFDDSGAGAAYNTVDASLWMFVAAYRYLAATRDREFLAAVLYPVLLDIIDWYRRGTRFDIRVGDDDLLSAGNEATQLTWMDADPGTGPVTPRQGQAVEVNALWYNALSVGAELARSLGDARRAADLAASARRTRTSFERAFWCPELGYLYDCVTGGQPDRSLRPNQIIALALPHDLLNREQAQSVLQHVTEKLLTPYGLRTLAPDSPGYRGRYIGDQYSRDRAYHQGTVWPWLLGPYMDAYVKLHGLNDTTRHYLRELTGPLCAHLHEAGLGSVSEIFDGDPPHYPRGCLAQAWSVGELLRCWIEYGLFAD